MQKLLGKARGKFTSSCLGVDSARFKGGKEIVQMMWQRLREFFTLFDPRLSRNLASDL